MQFFVNSLSLHFTPRCGLCICFDGRGGMNSVFEEQILAEKLSKLNSTQQCIETLSHWCIFHRSKAEIVVATWGKQFHSSQMVQKIPLLYLANDILQNSKRTGNEFVSEFWKVLPGALKDIIEKGDDHGKNVVSRLVGIWEERKVFGSHAHGLKDLMLGEQLPPPLEFSRKRSRSVRNVKRDSRYIRTKLTIGGAEEKIVSAFELVVSEHRSEDEEMSKCRSAIQRVKKLEEEVDLACSKAKDPNRKTLSKELEGEEHVLKESIEKLKVVEANRTALVSQLQEALHEQEAELENVRTQMQVAQARAEEARKMRKLLDDDKYIAVAKQSNTTPPPIYTSAKGGQQPKKSAAAIAAEVADRLAASTSSQYIMSSVLSSFAAEEAKNVGLTMSSSAFSSFPTPPVNSLSHLPPPELSTAPSTTYQSLLVQQPTLQQTQTLTSSQTQYHMVTTPSPQHYVQPSGVMVNSYSYVMPPLPPGPPPPQPPPQPHMVNNSAAASGANYSAALNAITSATACAPKFPSSWPLSASRNGLLWALPPVKLTILHR
ncbi:hypothetical protein RHMOL_Rhmol10G0234700 [Rhododendron molle]|uniref:Uncharacterized protein n=1 Tax=Rhododendron molle TaxID=49168 RepID=A0ACC0M6L4_RHOML|nr:hypothetical protein RHMOL_Rhmol10G0234700 [Rhododendron molle]